MARLERHNRRHHDRLLACFLQEEAFDLLDEFFFQFINRVVRINRSIFNDFLDESADLVEHFLVLADVDESSGKDVR